MRQKTDIKYNVDDFDDLTRFAAESFETDEIDLFQYTSETDSPLAPLKAIVLTLDWEISDSILQDLADELTHLGPRWRDDKVASLYLQGLTKIGKYLRLRGAYAHPNAIKLLFTFFHNFETIISEPDITGEQINTILQNDVRKFRVLQYQINLSEQQSKEGGDALPAGLGNAGQEDVGGGAASDTLRNFKAAILELDWEISKGSLENFENTLKTLAQEKAASKPATVLILGLQALGKYIEEERARAHPDAFNLLHAFHDGLDLILKRTADPSNRKVVQDILIDRVNRLNHLKKLIAPQESEVPKEIPITDLSPESAPRDFFILDPERDSLQRGNTLEGNDDESLIKVELKEELFNENSTPNTPEPEIEVITETVEEPSLMESLDEELPTSGSLFDAIEETSPINEDFPIELEMDNNAEKHEDTIASELKELFAVEKNTLLNPLADGDEEIEELSLDAYQSLDNSITDELIDINVGEHRDLPPALTGAEEQSGYNESDEILDLDAKADLDEQLNFFFGESESENNSPDSLFSQPPDEIIPDLAEVTIAGDTKPLFPTSEVAQISSDATEPPYVETIAALADIDVPNKDADNALEVLQEDEELSNRLDNFFGSDTRDEKEEANTEEAVISLELNEQDSIVAALSDVDAPEKGVTDSPDGPQENEELSNKLDNFFGSEGDEKEEENTEEAVISLELNEQDSVMAALSGFDAPEKEVADSLDGPQEDEELSNKLDNFFGSDGDEKEGASFPEAEINLELSEQDSVVAALADVDAPQDPLGKEEPDKDLEQHLDNFFTLPGEQHPSGNEQDDVTDQALDILNSSENGLLSDEQSDFLSEEIALGEVEIPEEMNTAFDHASDSDIQQLVDSFLDDKKDTSIDPGHQLAPVLSVIEETSSAVSQAKDTVFSVLDEGSTSIITVTKEETEPAVILAAETGTAFVVQGADSGSVDLKGDVPITLASEQSEEVLFTPMQDLESVQDDESNLWLNEPTFEDELSKLDVQEYILGGKDIEDIQEEGLTENADPNLEEEIPSAPVFSAETIISELGPVLPQLLHNRGEAWLASCKEQISTLLAHKAELNQTQQIAAQMLETITTSLYASSCSPHALTEKLLAEFYQMLMKPLNEFPVSLVALYAEWTQATMAQLVQLQKNKR